MLTPVPACPPVPTAALHCSMLSFVGLTYDLKRFPSNEIEKGELQMRQRALNAEKGKLFWGPDPDSLPLVSKDKVGWTAGRPTGRWTSGWPAG